MTAKRKRWPTVLAAVALVLLGAYWWFFVQAPEPSGDFTLDLREIRRQAQDLPGDKPVTIRVERVARFKFPRAVIRAGDGWGLEPMQVLSYQLVFPTHTAIIDTALTTAMPGGSLDDRSLKRLTDALPKADLIVVTHEHMDHLGGLTVQPNLRELLRVTKLNPEQVSHPEVLDPARFPPGSLDGYQPLAYAKSIAVAPGVVLIRAPGHTPGSQMVYVQTANETEFLFLGDVAWDRGMLEEQRERPRAMAMAIGEDRGAVMRQLQQLARIAKAEPGLHLVPGHDGTVIDTLVAGGHLKEEFDLSRVEAK